MEGKEKIEKLITSYLLDELDEPEKEYVAERIRTDANARQLFEELRKAVKLIGLKNTIEKVDLDKEWSNFEEARIRKEHPQLFSNEAERFGNEVIKELSLKRKARILKIVSVTAIAAAVLLAIGWGLSYLQKTRPAGSITATENEQKKNESVYTRFENRTNKPKQYFLDDGTEVTLAANSELSLPQPFEPEKRDLRLKGSALFNVAKDKNRPFTVYSGGISTTALGTSFTVTAFEQSNRILVSLHEGKVVVKGVDALKDKLKKEFYLLPGQEFVFEKNKPASTARVVNRSASAAGEKSLAKNERTNQSPDNPSIPKSNNGSWYMFNNQSLQQVLEQLSKMYNAEIVYKKQDIARINFIGTFSKTDSLESVLKQIVNANGLKLTREDNKYFITK
jgi:transmembrane sensor